MTQGSGQVTIVSQDFFAEAESVETVSIDDLVREQNLNIIDFNKMDIEGSELKALQGAEASVRRFRPQMAISVYHMLEDLFEIQQFISSLNMDYRYAMKPFTIHQEETVLFCF